MKDKIIASFLLGMFLLMVGYTSGLVAEIAIVGAWVTMNRL